MKNLTAGDVMHVYGGFDNEADYTVRLVVKMDDNIDKDNLEEAVSCASKRFPY